MFFDWQIGLSSQLGYLSVLLRCTGSMHSIRRTRKIEKKKMLQFTTIYEYKCILQDCKVQSQEDVQLHVENLSSRITALLNTFWSTFHGHACKEIGDHILIVQYYSSHLCLSNIRNHFTASNTYPQPQLNILWSQTRTTKHWAEICLITFNLHQQRNSPTINGTKVQHTMDLFGLLLAAAAWCRSDPRHPISDTWRLAALSGNGAVCQVLNQTGPIKQ